MLRDPSAEPAHDWNERVCAECYTPNSCAKLLDADGRIRAVYNNYSKLSFDFGPTLHRWLEGNYPTLNGIIINSGERAMAQAYNHIIMPLATERDRLTQTVWGVEDFKYRYGREPKGMWLPECAVDTPTQCRAVVTESGAVETPGGANLDVTRPYRCELPSGRAMTVLFYHAGIARDIAFGGLLDNGDAFKEAMLNAAVEGEGRILITATDGESYGHHHKFGEMALARHRRRKLRASPQIRGDGARAPLRADGRRRPRRDAGARRIPREASARGEMRDS